MRDDRGARKLGFSRKLGRVFCPANRRSHGLCALSDYARRLLYALIGRLNQRFECSALLSEGLARVASLKDCLHLPARLWPRLRLLDPVMGRQPCFNSLVVTPARFGGEVERERLVGFRGRVLRHALP
jgi:hypothetical protein